MRLDLRTLDKDRAEALRLTPVSRETLERLDRYVEQVVRWSSSKNLVAHSTLPFLWTRHVADSLQLLPLLGDDVVIADLGSGAGFPGLVLAAALADKPGAMVHCIESKIGKAAFLREASRICGLPVTVHARRIDDVVPDLRGSVRVVTARALAPLTDLLRLSYPLLKSGARAVFLKGQDVERELTDASICWRLSVERKASVTDPRGQVLLVHQADSLP
jgi:16S rRNA (guanine527-N7)-methyltransferase